MKGGFNTNATPFKLGWSYMSDSLKVDHYQDTSKDYGCEINCSWRPKDDLTIGWNKKWASVMDPMNKVSWALGMAHAFDKTLQWGVLLDGKSDTIATTKVNNCTLYFNHASGKKTVGADMKYDTVKKAFGCKLGLQMNQGDHTWKFRLQDTAVARVAL